MVDIGNALTRIGLALQGSQGAQALSQMDAKDELKQRQQQLIQIAQQQFGQSDPALAAIAASNPDIFAQMLADRYKAQNMPKKPESALAKLSQDYQQGLIPKEAYDAALAKETAPTKEQAEARLQQQGRQSLEGSLQKMLEAYNYLDENKAIPSTSRGVLENLSASIASSQPTIFGYELPSFQSINRARGTPEQTKRDFIKNSRTLVLQDIKNATGMSTQQLNSNVELKTFLQSLGDPSQSIETIRDTIANISRKFGTGALADGNNQGAPSMSQGISPSLPKRRISFGDLP